MLFDNFSRLRRPLRRSRRMFAAMEMMNRAPAPPAQSRKPRHYFPSHPLRRNIKMLAHDRNFLFPF
jgi:hypothetical protein